MGFIDDPLWRALAGMRISPEGAALTFTKRLSRENGWSRKHAEAVMEEYKRFLYLAATGSDPVTPSEQVDQAWHLHLSYTRHYWGELCAHIIGRPLHHAPTKGGIEGRKYRSLYAATLDRYRSTFAAEPPADIWPPVSLRFSARYQWVDRSRHYLLPRRVVSTVGIAGGATLLAACTALAVDSAGAQVPQSLKTLSSGVLSSDLGFVAFVVLLFLALVVIVTTINRLRSKGSSGRRKRSDDSSGGVGTDGVYDGWSGSGSGAAAAGGAAFVAGGGKYGGGGASGDWDSGGESGTDSGGSDSGGGDSGCGGGCGGD